EAADVILFAGFFWRNEICKGIIRFVVTGFLLLLTNMMKCGDLFPVGVVHGDVIMINTVRGPKAKYAASFNQFLVDQLAQHFLCIRKQIARSFADNLVLENARIFSR